MPNVATVLKEEIVRLARKEAKSQTAPLRKAAAQHRREIAALKRQLAAQERTITRLRKQAGKAQPAAASTNEATNVRFSPSWVAKHRTKLALSAADYAALVGVSGLTIYNWEKGKTRPQRRQLEALAAVRSLGKREAWKRLDEM